MKQKEIQSWILFYQEADSYFRRLNSEVKFSNEVLHGLASLACEKYFMALLLQRGIQPLGHTFADLIDASVSFIDFSDELKNTLLEMDTIVPLCPLDPAPIKPLSSQNAECFRQAAHSLKEISDLTLKVAEGASCCREK